MQIADKELAQYLQEIAQFSSASPATQEKTIASPKPRKPTRSTQQVDKSANLVATPGPLSTHPIQRPLKNEQVESFIDAEERPIGSDGLREDATNAEEINRLNTQNEAMQLHIEALKAEIRDLKSEGGVEKMNEVAADNTRLRSDLARVELEALHHEKEADDTRRRLEQLEHYYSTELGGSRKERSLIQITEQLREENKKLKVQAYEGIKEREQLRKQLAEFKRGVRNSCAAK